LRVADVRDAGRGGDLIQPPDGQLHPVQEAELVEQRKRREDVEVPQLVVEAVEVLIVLSE
jgi:hypothetical protein